jgi:hypothetical protein
MAAKNHFMVPTVPTRANITARLGAQSSGLGHKEENKIVKLTAESQYSLAAVGDKIEGYVRGVEPGTSNGFTVAGIYTPGIGDRVLAKADGLQGTPGTGTILVGDYVLTGTVTAAGTSMGHQVPAKVVKATTQASAMAGPFSYRVVSVAAFGGTGAVGDIIVLQREA